MLHAREGVPRHLDSEANEGKLFTPRPCQRFLWTRIGLILSGSALSVLNAAH